MSKIVFKTNTSFEDNWNDDINLEEAEVIYVGTFVQLKVFLFESLLREWKINSKKLMSRRRFKS